MRIDGINCFVVCGFFNVFEIFVSFWRVFGFLSYIVLDFFLDHILVALGPDGLLKEFENVVLKGMFVE